MRIITSNLTDILMYSIMFGFLHIVDINVNYIICVITLTIFNCIIVKIKNVLDLSSEKTKENYEKLKNPFEFKMIVPISILVCMCIITFVYPIFVLYLYDYIWISHLHIISNAVINTIIYKIITDCIISYLCLEKYLQYIVDNLYKYRKGNIV